MTLNKECFEDLGFSLLKDDCGDLWYICPNQKYDLIYSPNNHWMCITYVNHYHEEEQIFYGIIKTKDELKVLLKQLTVL